jgi:hypothetical protein
MIRNSEEFHHCGGLSDCETSSRAGRCLPDRKRVINRPTAKPRSVLQAETFEELDAEVLQYVMNGLKQHLKEQTALRLVV